MLESDTPRTEYTEAHHGCPMDIPHEHGLKRVEDGYVLDRLVLTDEVISELIILLMNEQSENRQFAARNLHDAPPVRAAPPLQEALGRETDAFTAGLLISALGTLKLPMIVPAIERWVARADEAFIAHNIMESYLQLLMVIDCEAVGLDAVCVTIGQTLAKLSQSTDLSVAQEAKRILNLFGLLNQ